MHQLFPIHTRSQVWWWQDAGERIRRGAAALQAVLAQDQGFYQQLAELQRTWKVRPRAQPSTQRSELFKSLTRC